jgi:hypothetical protein
LTKADFVNKIQTLCARLKPAAIERVEMLAKGDKGMNKHRLKVIGTVGILTLLILIGAVRANAEDDLKRFGFGFGFNFYRPMDSRFSGNGNLFLLTFRLSEVFDVSLLREEFRMNGSGVASTGGTVTANVDGAVTGLRITRRISNILHIGIDLGSVSYTRGIEDSSLMAGLVATITALESRDKLFNSRLDIDLGYRIFNLAHADVFNNPNNLVTGLDSFSLGMNFKIIF